MSSENGVGSKGNSYQRNNSAAGDQVHQKQAPPNGTNRGGRCPQNLDLSDSASQKEKKEAEPEHEEKLKECRNHRLRAVGVELQGIARIIDQHVAGELDIMSHTDELQQSRSDVDK